MMTKHTHHQFWPVSPSLGAIDEELRKRIVGHRQVTVAYLLGPAVCQKGVLVTFDQRVTHLLAEKIQSGGYVRVIGA